MGVVICKQSELKSGTEQGSELTLCNVNSVSCEASALPHQTTLLRQQLWYFPTHELVRHGLLAIWVQLVLVAHFPCPASCAVVVCLRLLGCFKPGLLRVERVPILVLRAADLGRAAHGVNHKHGIVGTINIRINAQTEQVLVVVCVDAGVHFSAPAVGVLAGIHGVCVEDTSELDLQLDSAVLVEDPIHAIFVVRSRKDVRDDELSGARDCAAVVPEVGVLKENSGIFLVNTDSVLNRSGCPGSVHKRSIEIVNRALAVTAQAKRVCHVATSVLSQIEGMLPLMRMFRVAIRHNHFGQREPPECVPFSTLIVERNVGKNKSFAVVEANVQFPVLPAYVPAIHCKRDSFWLSNVDWLQILPEPTLFFNGRRMVVVRWRLVNHSSDRGNIDVNNFLCIRVVDRAKIERVAVLAVVDVWAVIHECLLKTNTGTKTLVVTDGPS